MLCCAAHERLPAPRQEKRTHGQYERNAQEGTLVKRPFHSIRFPNLRGQAAAYHVHNFTRLALFARFHPICSSLARIA